MSPGASHDDAHSDAASPPTKEVAATATATAAQPAANAPAPVAGPSPAANQAVAPATAATAPTTAAAAPATAATAPTTAAAAPATTADAGAMGVAANMRGTVLERHGYTVGRSIGSGSYATVKIAHSDRHEREVAIKIVSKFRAPKDYLRKFLPREIEVVKGLRHRNLIRFYQAIETTHRVYIVMEYAANGSLLDVIRKESYIKEPRARNWFRQLVDAVEYCHNQGVVHRDIKCENLLLDEEMNVRLSDFGFARGRMKPRDRQPPPMSETFCGSYAYAAPEILRGTPYRPQLSDIWSMGVVLYAMVFGRLPFDDSNYTQLLKQVQSKVLFPRQPRVSAAVRSLITRILAPARTRLRIPDIRADVWMAAGADDTAHQIVKTIQKHLKKAFSK